jgi:hypothetical protein
VTEVPAPHYASCDDLDIADQMVGDGPRDLVMVPGFISNFVQAAALYWPQTCVR